MFRMIRNLFYILRVLRVLGRNDALFFLYEGKFPWVVQWIAVFFTRKIDSNRKGQNLANALYQLGPTYIKLGQALSIRADIVGDELAEDLEKLQDKLPPFPFELVKKTIENEFSKPVEELFSEFEKKPVAAASIAQVHFAKDMDGKEVAVKILRPNIKKKFTADIEFLYWAAALISNLFYEYRRLKLPEVVKKFATTSSVEMDFRLEASAACELAENFKDTDYFKVPKINWDMTSERVLTMERVGGLRIDDVKGMQKAGINPDDVLQKASNVFFLQVFRDGFFHADQHPGNVFVDKDGNIIVVDFGIMGRIDLESQLYLAQMLLGFLNRDYRKVADIHFDAGYVPADQDRDLFMQAVRSIGEPIHGKPQNEISIAKLLRQMFKITEDFQMETQPQLLLLQKTMMLAEGLGRKLNPEANFWMISKPLIEQWGTENLGAKGKAKQVACEAKKIMTRVNHIITIADRLPEIITSEGIKLHPRTIDALARRRSKKIDYLKIALLSAVVSAITMLLLNMI